LAKRPQTHRKTKWRGETIATRQTTDRQDKNETTNELTNELTNERDLLDDLRPGLMGGGFGAMILE
jgi:hypothetical protein